MPSLHDLLVSKYGFKFGEHFQLVRIEDTSGLAAIRREFRDLEIVVDGFRLRTLAHYSETTGSDGPVTFEVLKPGSVQIASRPRQWFGVYGVSEVEFKPHGLQKGRPISYALSCQSRDALLVRKVDIERKYAADIFPMEYYVTRPQFPVDQLVIELEFPDGHLCECTPVVFLPRSELSMERLADELEKGFVRTARGARLVVPQPLVEFGYGICWSGV